MLLLALRSIHDDTAPMGLAIFQPKSEEVLNVHIDIMKTGWQGSSL